MTDPVVKGAYDWFMESICYASGSIAQTIGIGTVLQTEEDENAVTFQQCRKFRAITRMGATEGRSKSRTKGHMGASSLVVSTGDPKAEFVVSICATHQACGLATSQPLLQSAAMSVMRHAACTGSKEPQTQHKPAGRRFRLAWIQSRRPGRNARSLRKWRSS